jgi:hypothetical protein
MCLIIMTGPGRLPTLNELFPWRDWVDGNKAKDPEQIMGFTVTRPGGTNDSDFQTYARLLRQLGVDLGRVTRVPEPGTNRRWLHVWNSREEAQAFVKELSERMASEGWQVLEVNGQASEGPLGPLVIQLVRRADGLTFALHPLSRALIRSAFPEAVNTTTYASIDTAAWNDFRKTKGDLMDLIRDIAPGLTGLPMERIEQLGLAVVDDATAETLLSSPPAMTVQG